MVISDEDFIPEMVGFADCICCGTNKTRETLNSWIRYMAGFRSEFPSIGERVICRNNDWDIVQDGIALANGLAGYVVNNMDITKYDGKKFFIDFKPDLTNTVFYNIPVDVRYFKGDINVKNEMRNFNTKTYDNGNFFDYSYALTTHLAQGGEFDNGIYIEEFIRPQINNQLNYTGITRFKKKLIYVKKASKNIYIPEVNFNETSK
jgi:exodeoxyribonuclease-5